MHIRHVLPITATDCYTVPQYEPSEGDTVSYVLPSRPAQFRLPQWVHDYLEERSAAKEETKTQVVIEAIECLRQRELEALMAEGYREQAASSRELAEEMLPAGAETLHSW
jgi:hypothetical protein